MRIAGSLKSMGATAAGPAVAKTLPVSIGLEGAPARVYEIDPLRDPRWAGFVDKHPRASVFHSSKWLQALSSVYDYEPVAMTTCSPSDSLTNGLVFCRIRSWLTGRRLVSLPFSDHCEPLVDSSDQLDEILFSARKKVDEKNWKYIEIRPLGVEPSRNTKLGIVVTNCFHRLELCRSEQELFHGFHKDCIQRKIRRAERENLKYEEGTTENLLQEFYRLMVLTRRRQYLPPQPLNWFRGLIAAFGEDIKIRVASKNGVAVASILTLWNQRSMVYKYGCSDAEFNKFGGMPFLFWRSILEAKEKGCKEFDLGRSNTDNAGLIAFKEHWGATRRLISYWSYPAKPAKPQSEWKKSLAHQVVSTVPDLALKAVGTLFYRHIG